MIQSKNVRRKPATGKVRPVSARLHLEPLEDRCLLSAGQWYAVIKGVPPAADTQAELIQGQALFHSAGVKDQDVQVVQALDLSGTFVVQSAPTLSSQALTSELKLVPGFSFFAPYNPPPNEGDPDGGDLINQDYLDQTYGPFDYQTYLNQVNQGKFPPQGGPVDPGGTADILTNNNTGSTGTANFTHSETSTLVVGSTVLVSYNDSGSNAGGSNKFTGFSRSTDGGATFTDGGTLPNNANGDAGDPVLAVSKSTGRIFFATLQFSGSGMDVFHSDDNGATWSAPVQGAPGKSGFQDKEWIAVDNTTGAGYGNVYQVNRDFGGGNGIYFYRSTDNGATFGPSGGTFIATGSQGAFVVVSPDHSVEVFWFAGPSLQMRKSTDQGATFGAAVTVATGLVGGVNGDLGLTGIRAGLVAASGFRSSEFPHVAVNPVNGDLYVTYDNKGAGADKSDVFFTQSSNGGATWSAPVKVNDDATTTDQWQPTIAVLPDGSGLGVFYYSRQQDVAGDNLFNYYGRLATISGHTVTFSSPSIAVSDTASLPEFGRDAVVNSVYMGDYNTAYATAAGYSVAWSDNRLVLPGGGGRQNPNVYFKQIPVAAGSGVWTPLTNTAPATTGTMFLLTDGTVAVNGGNASNFYRLTPDASGSYINGAWSNLASMSTPRLYYGSNVLPNGNLFVVGGEYSGVGLPRTDINTGEIYNPVANTWTPIATFPQPFFGDDPTMVLSNGLILAGYERGPQTYLYNPATDAWTPTGTKLRNDQSDEESWIKLADGSVLSYDVFSSISLGVGHAQRYIPATGTWVDAGIVPVSLSSAGVGFELGAGLLLPDGRVFQIGANGNTAFYTPSTNTWTAGPVIPSGLGADDAPAAVLPNGHVILSADTPLFHGPTKLFDFDPVGNTLTPVGGLPASFLSGASYIERMLVLPNGDLLLSNSSNQLYELTPSAGPLSALRPTISSVVANLGGVYTLTGTQLNGLSEGSSYGDDVSNSTNYPIVQLSSGGAVYYARTFGWVSQVATGAALETTQFTLPAGLPAGEYTLKVIANGVPSAASQINVGNFAFAPVNPLGSLVYVGSAGDNVAVAGSINSLSFSINAGQTLAVVVTPTDPGLQPTFQVLDASSNVVGGATAAAAGSTALQQVFSAAGGLYTIDVGGSAGTTGHYSIKVYLNAAIDVNGNGGSNNTLGTAQDLTGSFLTVGNSVGSAARADVVATTATSTYSASAVSAAFEDISSTGTIIAGLQGADDASVSITPGGGFTFSLYGATYNALYVSSNGLITFGSANSEFTNQNLTNDPTQAAIAPFWDDQVVTGAASSHVFFQVLGSGANQHLDIQWNNISFFNDSPRTGGLTYEAQLYADGRIQFNYQSLVTGNNSGSHDDGASATVGIKDVGTQGLNRLLLAFNNGPNAFVGSNQSTLITPAADYYKFTAAAGDNVTVGMKQLVGSGAIIQLLNSGGGVLASGVAGSTNLDQVISNFALSAAGAYYITVTGGNGQYNLVLTKNTSFDTEANNGPAAAQSQDVTPTLAALGDVGGSDFSDNYKLTLAAGQTTLTIATSTPSDGPNVFHNTLNPHLQLLDSAGNPVPGGQVQLTIAADGRNEQLLASGLTPGATYVVVVTAEGGTQGEYFLAAKPLANISLPIQVDDNQANNNKTNGLGTFALSGTSSLKFFGWTTVTAAAAFHGSEQVHAGAATDTADAAWTYPLYVPAAASYTVYASWAAAPGNATNAAYKIYIDQIKTGPVATVVVDQTKFPNSALSGATLIQKLASVAVGAGSHTIFVILSDVANGNVVADGVFDPPEAGADGAGAESSLPTAELGLAEPATDAAALGSSPVDFPIATLAPTPGGATATAQEVGATTVDFFFLGASDLTLQGRFDAPTTGSGSIGQASSPSDAPPTDVATLDRLFAASAAGRKAGGPTDVATLDQLFAAATTDGETGWSDLTGPMEGLGFDGSAINAL